MGPISDAPGGCAAHPDHPAAELCRVCGRGGCVDCLGRWPAPDVCSSCLAAREPAAEGELTIVALHHVALAGAWLLFGTTLFRLQYGEVGVLVSAALGAAAFLSAVAARVGARATPWLVTGFAPFHLLFPLGEYRGVRWDLLADPGLDLWLWLGHSLVLAGLLAYGVHRVHSSVVSRSLGREYARLRRETLGLDPGPFPFYGAASVLVWLLLQMAFWIDYTRQTRLF